MAEQNLLIKNGCVVTVDLDKGDLPAPTSASWVTVEKPTTARASIQN